MKCWLEVHPGVKVSRCGPVLRTPKKFRDSSEYREEISDLRESGMFYTPNTGVHTTWAFTFIMEKLLTKFFTCG